MSTTNPRPRLARRLAPASALLLLAAAGCGGGDDASEETTEPASDSPEVVMELIAYDPDVLEIEVGTEVTWTQNDAGQHSVTSGTVEDGDAGVTPMPDGEFDSGLLDTGDTFAQTFDEAGTFTYFCTIHPATMRGEVRVS